MAAGDQIVMRTTLEESIAAIYSTVLPEEPDIEEPDEEEPPTSEEPVSAEIAALIEEAWQHYERAQEFLQAGDWAGYGEALEAFEEILQQLVEFSAGE